MKLDPAPQQVSWRDFALDLRNLHAFVRSPACQTVDTGIDMVNQRLTQVGLPALPVSETGVADAIHLSVEPDPAMEKRFPPTAQPRAEGYRLMVDRHDIFVLGKDLPGLFHGLMTLLQLIDRRGTAAGVVIADWPDLPFRASLLFNNTSLAAAQIPHLATRKVNAVVYLYFVRSETQPLNWYSLYDENSAAYRAAAPQLQEFSDICRRHFITVIPTISGLSHSQDVLGVNRNTVEGLPLRQLFPIVDAHVYSPPKFPPELAIANADFEKSDPHTNLAAGWHQDAPGQTSFVDVDDPAHSRCLRLQGATAAPVVVYQDVAFADSGQYRLSFQIKCTALAPGSAHVAVFGLPQLGGDPVPIAESESIGEATAWKTIEFPVAAKGFRRIRVALCLEGTPAPCWFDNLEAHGVEQENDLDNVIITEAAPVSLFTRDMRPLKEGVDYSLDTSLLSYPFAVGKRLGIEILRGAPVGDSVWVDCTKGQIRTPQFSVTCCPSEPAYYEVIDTTARHAIALLRPDFIHIGHDEISVMNQDMRCLERKLSKSELLADDIIHCYKCIKGENPKIQILMWADAISPFHDPDHQWYGDDEYLPAVDAIPRDIIMNIWWYDYPDDRNRIEDSMNFFLGKGFRVVGSPWYDPANARQWAESLYRHSLENANALGGLYTCWPLSDDTPENGARDLFMAALWHHASLAET